ncbi:MAG: hypothetical protein D6772_00950, partial [Bacteroidetes bacterium]
LNSQLIAIDNQIFRLVIHIVWKTEALVFQFNPYLSDRFNSEWNKLTDTNITTSLAYSRIIRKNLGEAAIIAVSCCPGNAKQWIGPSSYRKRRQ